MPQFTTGCTGLGFILSPPVNVGYSNSASVDRLPTELVLEISKHYHALGPHDAGYLTGVCKFWKGVIEDYPSFWTRIEITTHRDFRKVDRYLRHSGSLPLDISLDLPPYVRLPNDPNEAEAAAYDVANRLELCIQSLKRYSHRWETLEIRGHRAEETGLVMRLLTDVHIPALKELLLTDYNPLYTEAELYQLHPRWSPTTRVRRTVSSPNLAVMRIEQCFSRHGFNIMSGVTALHLGIPASYDSGHTLLSPFPGPSGVAEPPMPQPRIGRRRTPGRGPFQGSEPFHVPSLLYLHLESAKWAVMCDILLMLRAPVLKAVHFTDHSASDAVDDSTEESFGYVMELADGGANPYAGVQSVTFKGCRSSDVVGLLALFPGARFLTVYHCYYLGNWVNALDVYGQDTHCQGLEVLALSGETLVSDVTCKGMITHRVESGNLKRLRLLADLESQSMFYRELDRALAEELSAVVDIELIHTSSEDDEEEEGVGGEVLAQLYASATEVDDWSWHKPSRSW